LVLVGLQYLAHSPAKGMAGLGIAMVSTVMAFAEVKAGALVPLLCGYKLSAVAVLAVFSDGPRHRPRFARWSIISPRSCVRKLPNEHFRFGVARPT